MLRGPTAPAMRTAGRRRDHQWLWLLGVFHLSPWSPGGLPKKDMMYVDKELQKSVNIE